MMFKFEEENLNVEKRHSKESNFKEELKEEVKLFLWIRHRPP